MFRWSCVFAFCAALSACVVNPHHGQNVGPRNTPITFEIYATKPNAALSVTCSSHFGPASTIATFTGGSNPITYAEETVYAKQRTITIPNSCWESWSGSGFNFITYIRVKQGNDYAVVFDAPGLDCLWEAIGDTTGPITAGFNCKRSGADILLYAL